MNSRKFDSAYLNIDLQSEAPLNQLAELFKWKSEDIKVKSTILDDVFTKDVILERITDYA